jgi:hypothetical protein
METNPPVQTMETVTGDVDSPSDYRGESWCRFAIRRPPAPHLLMAFCKNNLAPGPQRCALPPATYPTNAPAQLVSSHLPNSSRAAAPELP